MHPDIRKFWEHRYLVSVIEAKHINYQYYYIKCNNEVNSIIILARVMKLGIQYYFNGGIHSEENMLKLIKLKAFL